MSTIDTKSTLDTTYTTYNNNNNNMETYNIMFCAPEPNDSCAVVPAAVALYRDYRTYLSSLMDPHGLRQSITNIFFFRQNDEN